ncbi:MAG: ABC transporter ATP-binding protein [Anaerolineae bacterium]|nr:ABC transporter ATP-binding protein [Thermoflexus sp.]MDW8064522.1 ABC transporter ATP-binding protein [Anaerolineae bacterium]
MPFIEMRGITKVYPNGVMANHQVNFEVEAGEIHALVGENGAGKTTLMKILYGMERPNAGEIRIRGVPVQIRSPFDAIRLGIGMVHQNLMLIPEFTVAENILLGVEPHRWGLWDRSATLQTVRSLAERYGLSIDPEARVADLPVGVRQRVEIIKVLHRGVDLIILDEPTALLTPQETQELFRTIRELVKQGKTVILITHKLREVKAISDRITVMRHGRIVGTLPTAEASEEELAAWMIGRRALPTLKRPPARRGPCILRVENLSYIDEGGRAILREVSFEVHSGEILGIAGVEGNGQSELVEILAGLRQPTAGEIWLDGERLPAGTPRRIRSMGIAHIPEDRLRNGVALPLSIAENLIADRYFEAPFSRSGWLNPGAIRRYAEDLIRAFDIRAPDPEVPAEALSGGNLQRVILARELSRRPRLLLAAQPTRGLDVGATEAVHHFLWEQRSNGAAVLLVSADLSELISLSDRLAVMHDGEIVAIFPEPQRLSEEEIGLYMLGLRRQPLEREEGS